MALVANWSRDELPTLWRLRWWARAGAALIATAAALTSYWAVLPLRVEASHGDALPEVAFSSRFSSRAVLYDAGLAMVRDNPLFGVGPGRFGTHLDAYTREEERASSWPPLRDRVHWDPHSTWLGILTETGTVGLVCWMLLLAWAVRNVARSPDRFAARVALSTVVGIAVSACFVSLLHLKFLWAALGLALSTASGEAPPRRL